MKNQTHVLLEEVTIDNYNEFLTDEQKSQNEQDKGLDKIVKSKERIKRFLYTLEYAIYAIFSDNDIYEHFSNEKKEKLLTKWVYDYNQIPIKFRANKLRSNAASLVSEFYTYLESDKFADKPIKIGELIKTFEGYKSANEVRLRQRIMFLMNRVSDGKYLCDIDGFFKDDETHIFAGKVFALRIAIDILSNFVCSYDRTAKIYVTKIESINSEIPMANG